MGLGRRHLTLAFVVALVLSVGSGGIARAEAEPRLDLSQAVYEKSGQPLLVANFVPDGSLASPSWVRCDEAGRCIPGPAANAVWEPGPTPSGTTFEARARYLGADYTVRSPRWLGALHSTRRPTLSGLPVVGRIVPPMPGTWTGGWDRAGDFSRLRVEVCRTRTPRSCRTVSAQGEDYPGHGAPPVIKRRYVGWYAFAIEERFAPGSAFAGVGYRTSEAIPPAKTGPTVVRSRPLGPITPR